MTGCAECGGPVVQPRKGRRRIYCAECGSSTARTRRQDRRERAQRDRTYAVGIVLTRLRSEFTPLVRVVSRPAPESATLVEPDHIELCGCGRDYMTVPLDEPCCPRPFYAERKREAAPERESRRGAPAHPQRERALELIRDGLTNEQVAQELGLKANTVGVWRSRYGLGGTGRGRPAGIARSAPYAGVR